MEKMDAEMANLKISEGEDLEKAVRLRLEGNEFYKAGNLVKAIDAYNEADTVAPHDPLPWSNLSAVYFEGGQYRLCVQSSQQAIDRAGNQKSFILSKVFPRMMKSLMNLLEWESARKFWVECKQDPAMSTAFDERILEQAEKCWKLMSDDKATKRKVFWSGPRYREAIWPIQPRYWNFGLDSAESLFDKELAKSPGALINLFFGGIGDGRNLFATLIAIASHERATTKNFKYHITINDINPHSIARLLVVFHIFEDIAVTKAKKDLDEAERLTHLTASFATLYYLCASVAMPPDLYNYMHSIICNLINLLNNGESTISGIDIGCCTTMVRVLKSWRDDAPSMFPVSLLLEEHIKTQKNADTLEAHHTVAKQSDIEGLEGERSLWQSTGAILARPMQLYDKSLLDMMKTLASSPLPTLKALKSHLAQEWKPNVTILDLDWVKNSHETHQIRYLTTNVAFDPFTLVTDLYKEICRNQDRVILEKPERSSSTLEDYIVSFFQAAFEAWSQTDGIVKIEALVGDVMDIFEGFQLDVFDSSRSESHPKQFDRIHMTNIQDFVGGPLAICLYPATLIRPGPGRFVTGECLTNWMLFMSVSQYLNESMIIDNNESLAKLMRIELSQHPKGMDLNYLIDGYQRWQRTSDKPLPISSLCSRSQLTKWLYALFFKLSVPVDQRFNKAVTKHGSGLVFPTLNLSIFFRVLWHLHEIGYPGHWLSEILGKILDNDVVTSARPPRTSPLQINESREGRSRASRKLGTAPYILEMRSLTTRFQRFLPFAMSTVVPTPNTVSSYAVVIPISKPCPEMSIQQSALVFHRASLMNKIHPPQSKSTEPLEHILRNPFDTIPGNPATLKDYQDVYEKGLVVISAFSFHPKEQAAVFLMSSEDFASIFGDGKDWKASLWGFLFWERYTPLVDVSVNMVEMDPWLSEDS